MPMFGCLLFGLCLIAAVMGQVPSQRSGLLGPGQGSIADQLKNSPGLGRQNNNQQQQQPFNRQNRVTNPGTQMFNPDNNAAPAQGISSGVGFGIRQAYGPNLGELLNAIVNERVRGLRQEDKIQQLQNEILSLRTEVETLNKEMAIAKPLSQQLGQLIKEKSRRIAFIAELQTGKTFEAGSRIIFETTKFNEGNFYNTTDGVFYSPSEGLYLFSTFIIAQSRAYHAQIVKNGIPVGFLYTHDTIDGKPAWGSASTTIVLRLMPGDRVWVNSFDKSLISNWSTFTGSLIR